MNNDQNDFDNIEVVGAAMSTNIYGNKSKTNRPIPQNVEEFGMEGDISSYEDLIDNNLLVKDNNGSNSIYQYSSGLKIFSQERVSIIINKIT